MAKPIKIEILGEASSFERAMLKVDSGLSNLEGKVRNVTGKMESVGRTMTTAVTLPIVAAGVGAFKFAADYQDAVGAVEQIFGSAAGEVQNWANNLKSYYGVAKGEALQHASVMGSLLQNIGGMAEAEAAKTSGTLVELASDLSAMFGGSTDTAIQALTGALKGNKEMLDNYGISVTEASLKAKAMDMGLLELNVDQLKVKQSTLALEQAQMRAAEAIRKHGKNSDEARIATEKVEIAQSKLDKVMEGSSSTVLTDQQKQQAMLAIIMEQTAKAQGQAAREAEGASGQMRAFSAEVKNLGTDIGTQLLPVGTKLIGTVRSIMQRFQALSPQGQKTAIVMAGIAAAIGPVLIILAKLVNATMTLVKASVAFVKFGAAATKASVTVVKAVATKVAAVASATAQMVAQVARQVAAWVLLGAQSMLHAAKVAAAWLIAMGPIGLVIAAVVGLVAAIIVHWDTITEVISKAAKKVGQIITALWDGIVDAFNSVRATVSNIWNSLWSTVVGFITQTVPRVVGQVSSMVSQVISWVGSLPGRALSAVGNLGSLLISKGRDLIQGLQNGITGMWGTVSGWLGGIGSRVRSAVGDLGRALYGAGQAILQGLWNGMRAKWDQVAGWVGGLGDKIANLKGPIEYDRVLLIKQGQAIIQGLGKGMAAAWPGIERQLSTYTSNIAGFNPAMGLSTGVSGGSLRGGSMGPAPMGGNTNVAVNVQSNANPHDIAREVAWTLRTRR